MGLFESKVKQKITLEYDAKNSEVNKINEGIAQILKNCSADEIDTMGKLSQNSMVKSLAISKAKEYI
jgi:stage V sporulation protein SpoVS